MRAFIGISLASAMLTPGCFSAPTPLAPGLAGSVGMPNHGVQTGAVELPKTGKGFQRYRPKGQNHWGRPRLVSALTRIAAGAGGASRAWTVSALSRRPARARGADVAAAGGKERSGHGKEARQGEW